MFFRNVSVSMTEFVPARSLRGMEDFTEESEYYDAYNRVEEMDSGFSVQIRPPLRPIRYPRQLEAMFCPASNLTRLPHPRPTLLGSQDFYCLDLASVLAVVALGLEPSDNLLDTCAGPGGKSLVAAQTLLPTRILCNDVKGERLRRVREVMDSYLKGVGDVRDRVHLSLMNATELPLRWSGCFHKVLCDVPCSTDRTSLHDDENNIFASHRKAERIKMPQMQTDLLV